MIPHLALLEAMKRFIERSYAYHFFSIWHGIIFDGSCVRLVNKTVITVVRHSILKCGVMKGQVKDPEVWSSDGVRRNEKRCSTTHTIGDASLRFQWKLELAASFPRPSSQEIRAVKSLAVESVKSYFADGGLELEDSSHA